MTTNRLIPEVYVLQAINIQNAIAVRIYLEMSPTDHFATITRTEYLIECSPKSKRVLLLISIIKQQKDYW